MKPNPNVSTFKGSWHPLKLPPKHGHARMRICTETQKHGHHGSLTVRELKDHPPSQFKQTIMQIMLQANLKTCEGLYHASTVVGQFLNLQLANRNVLWATRKGLGEQGWLAVSGVRFCKASPWSSPPLCACLLSPLNSPQKVILPFPSRVFTLFLLNGDGSFLQEVCCKQWLSKWG